VRYCFPQVELEVQARLGVAITTYNVISFTKTKLGDGYATDYCIKVHNYVCKGGSQTGFTLHVPM